MNPNADLDALLGAVREKTPAPRAKYKKRERPEHALHLAVRKYLSVVIAPPGELSRSNAVWYTIGHEAALSMYAGAARKARGVVKGIPDIDIYWNERAYKIELKVEGGVLSTEQKDLHATLRATGVHVSVCYSLNGVVEQIAAWRIPVRARCA